MSEKTGLSGGTASTDPSQGPVSGPGPSPGPAPDGQTGFTALFIRRPILAAVANALMVVAGLAAFYGIEVRELPDVDRPVITVRTSFDGAATRQSIPAASRNRANPKPVGPAS